MREAIKMIFFRSVFLFGLISLIYIIKRYIEDKWSDIQSELNEKKEHEKEIMALKKKCEFLEEYGAKRMNLYYKLSERHYKILEFQIYGKSVEEWEREDRKVSRKKK